jgi:hypothetical protein
MELSYSYAATVVDSLCALSPLCRIQFTSRYVPYHGGWTAGGSPFGINCIITYDPRGRREDGIDPEDTGDYRAREGIFDSDDIQEMVDEREGRKRGVSDALALSTDSHSRQPSSTKVQRR